MKAVIGLIVGLLVGGLGVLFLTEVPEDEEASEMTQAETAQMEAEARQAIADQWAVMIDAGPSKDYERYLSCWTPDVQLLEPGVDVTGIEAFRDHMDEFFSTGAEILEFNRESREISVYQDVAYEMGQYTNLVGFPGVDPAEFGSNFFAKWQRGMDGVWRISRFVAGSMDAPEEG